MLDTAGTDRIRQSNCSTSTPMPNPQPFDIEAQLGPETLTAALRSAGLLRQAHVDAVRTQVIGQ